MAEAPDPLRELRRDLPPGLEAVVLRCLEKEAPRRYQDVAALAQALAPFGQAEARSAADRIGRVMRGKLASSVDLSADAVATTNANPRRDIAQTAAAFGTASTSTVRRKSVLPFVAGAALLAVLGIVAAIATRSSDASKGAAAQASGTTPAALSAEAPASAQALAPAQAPAPTQAPTAATAPAQAPTAASSLAPAPTESVAPPAPNQGHPHARPKPVAPPAAVPTAKPAATSGFGGRD